MNVNISKFTWNASKITGACEINHTLYDVSICKRPQVLACTPKPSNYLLVKYKVLFDVSKYFKLV